MQIVTTTANAIWRALCGQRNHLDPYGIINTGTGLPFVIIVYRLFRSRGIKRPVPTVDFPFISRSISDYWFPSMWMLCGRHRIT